MLSELSTSNNLDGGAEMFAEPEVVRQLHRMSLEEYHRLGELGLIDRKTELLRGVLIDKVSESPFHAWLTANLAHLLREGIGEGWIVRSESPLTLEASGSEPEPDVSVVRGAITDFRYSHPTTAALAIEIAISTEKLDRSKAFVYAESGFEEYWLFLPKRQKVEVYREPIDGRYQSVTTLGLEDRIAPLAFPGLVIELRHLLGDTAK